MTEQTFPRMVKRICRVILRDGTRCGNEYRVEAGSKAQGCPTCCPRLELYPPPKDAA